MKCLCGCGAEVGLKRYVRFHHLRVKTPEHIAKLKAMLPRARAMVDEEKLRAGAAAALKRRWASKENRAKAAERWKGDRNPLWNSSGEKLNKTGRTYVKVNGVWRARHRVVAEAALGRSLVPGEVVHHFNENKSDDRNTNLLICSDSYHRALHRRMLALARRGNAFWREL